MSVRSPFKYTRLPEQTPKLPLVSQRQRSEVDSISCDTVRLLLIFYNNDTKFYLDGRFNPREI